MSVETYATLSHVYISEDGNGFSAETIRRVHDQVVTEENPALRGLRIALDDVLSAVGDQIDVTEALARNHRYLLGLTAPDSTENDRTLDAVLYLKATKQRPNEAYGTVEKTIWTSKDRKILYYEDDELRRDLAQLAFTDVVYDHAPEHSVRVPVDRDTLVIVTNPLPDEQASYWYGESRDMQALQQSGIPMDLRFHLEAVTQAYHAARHAQETPQPLTIDFSK